MLYYSSLKVLEWSKISFSANTYRKMYRHSRERCPINLFLCHGQICSHHLLNKLHGKAFLSLAFSFVTWSWHDCLKNSWCKFDKAWFQLSINHYGPKNALKSIISWEKLLISILKRHQIPYRRVWSNFELAGGKYCFFGGDNLE